MKKQFLSVVVATLVLFTIAGCKKDKTTTTTTTPNSCVQCGYNFSTEHLGSVPTSLNTRSLNLTGSTPGTLPSSVDLTKYLPPIGDQGQYGTCVAWASGYNMKTALEAISGGLTTSQLTNTNMQMSPKDLYLAIADNDKSGCEGTNFDIALTVIQNRGVATMATVPYDNLGTCSNSGSDASWATSAANHKIKSFRKLDVTVDAVKQALANNQPVVIGTEVGTNFQNWRTSAVMTTGFDPVGSGQGGGHAMLCVGYDDSKGAGGAFRVINSWSTTWGDNGGFWVDYNFMLTTLCNEGGTVPLFVADNAIDSTAPPQPNTNPTSGVDLAAWAESDFNTSGTTGVATSRELVFNIYNIGTGDASPASNWGLYYVYYNAFNANDYGVIFYDNFNTSIPTDTFNCPAANNCIVNFAIPANGDLATTAFGTSVLHQDYNMPNITGQYYIVLLADPSGVLNDVNYDNNIFYTTNYPATFSQGYAAKTGGDPLTFKNPNSPSRTMVAKNGYNTAVTSKTRNAYRPDEIIAFLKAKKKSGELDSKAAAVAGHNSSNIKQLHGK